MLQVQGGHCSTYNGTVVVFSYNIRVSFLHTSVDYAGPVLIADRKGCGCRFIKSFLAIFACSSTKACYIELVTALSGDAYIAAFNNNKNYGLLTKCEYFGSFYADA